MPPCTGYVASESTTGTRTATKIADLPFVVNVVTADFLNDFDFFSITDGLGYAGSVSSLDTEGNANLRGFATTFQEWNGFYRLGIDRPRQYRSHRSHQRPERVHLWPDRSCRHHQYHHHAAIEQSLRKLGRRRRQRHDLFRVEGHVDASATTGGGTQVGQSGEL